MANANGRPKKDRPARPPATTPEARRNQLVAQAYDLAEKQIAEGNASAQVITHFLKLGTERERVEVARIQGEVALTQAKIQSLASADRIEELYTNAMSAMREYQGRSGPDDDAS